MSRSLAFVGILTIIGIAGNWSAYGQETTGQTSQGEVVSNHMTDAERDRLMEEAMEAARLELEKKKAQEKADKINTERVKAEEREKASAAETKKKADAEQKAREERLARELAETEKNASSKQADSKDLDSLEPLKADQEPEKKTASKSDSTAEQDKKKPEETRKASTVAKAKSSEGSKKSSAESKPETAPEKVVVKTVSTKQPGSGISVKTSMPVGDEARKAEQTAAANGYAARSSSNADGGSGGEMSLSGRVVGMMRGTGGPPRILLSSEDNRMVQVVMEQPGSEIPAPGAYVSVRGRDVSGGAGRMVVSAASISVKGSETREAPPAPEAPQIAIAPPPGPLGPPMIAGPPPPMLGAMPPPGPMFGGPMIIGGPPPMF